MGKRRLVNGGTRRETWDFVIIQTYPRGGQGVLVSPIRDFVILTPLLTVRVVV
jgi:hypothetical protein